MIHQKVSLALGRIKKHSLFKMGPPCGPHYPITGHPILKLSYLSSLKVEIKYAYCSYKMEYNGMIKCGFLPLSGNRVIPYEIYIFGITPPRIGSQQSTIILSNIYRRIWSLNVIFQIVFELCHHECRDFEDPWKTSNLEGHQLWASGWLQGAVHFT